MPRVLLDATAPGSSDQWGFFGAAASWQAVASSSDDTSYIYTSAPGATSDFYCGSCAPPPIIGSRAVGLAVHYRVRATVPFSGAVIQVSISQGGVAVFSNVTLPSDAWVDGVFRARDSWSAPPVSRPVSADLVDLGVHVTVAVPPASGQVEISQLWLAFEYLDTPMVYDPMGGMLPDVMTGPLSWLAFGGQPAILTPSNHLNVAGTVPGDGRIYAQQSPLVYYRGDYCTEFETRCSLSSPTVGTYHMGYIFLMYDNRRAVSLSAVKVGTEAFVGLVSINVADPASYYVLVPIDTLQDNHYRLVIDRDPDPSTYGKVSAYLNYSPAPFLEWNFADFATTLPPFSIMAFGAALSTIQYDYFSFKHYKKRGYTFRAWQEFDQDVNLVASSSSDTDIVHHFTISPPGVEAGQSDNVCVLDVVDPSPPCSVSQSIQLAQAFPTTYRIDLDYKILSGVPVTAELLVQRVRDQWYWDPGLSTWVPVYTAITIPYSPVRIRQPLVAGIGDVVPEDIIITVKSRQVLGPVHQILIYKVMLASP